MANPATAESTTTVETDYLESLVGSSPKCPIRSVATFRSPVDPNLFLVSAHYGECGYSACACGYDLAETRKRAIVEGIERKETSSPRHVPGGVVMAAARNLTQPYLDPAFYVPLDREKLKDTGLRPYSPKRKLRWANGVSLDVSRPSPLIPLDLIYYHYRSIDRLYYANSSGVAAHTDRALAFENAVAELVERDALMRFWISGQARNVSNCAALSNYVVERMDYWQSVGRQLSFYSLPSEYGDVVLAIITGDTWPAFACGAAARLRCLEVTIRPRNELNLFERALFEAEGNYVVYSNYEHIKLRPSEVHSPFDHNLFYCEPDNFRLIQSIFFSHEPSLDAEFPDRPVTIGQLQTIYNRLDLTCFWLTGPPVGSKPTVHVVRVLSPKLIPISFSLNLFHIEHAEVKKLLCELDADGSDERIYLYPHFFP